MASFNLTGKMLRILIFYILLEIAAGAIQYGYQKELDNDPEPKLRYDQLLANIHSLFKPRRNIVDEKSKPNDGTEDNHINKNDKQNFKEVLGEVTDALEKIKDELMKFSNDGLITIEVPAVNKEKRYKREISNETISNATSSESNETLIIDNVSDYPDSVTEPLAVLRVGNDTESYETTTAATNDTLVSGRRMLPSEYITTSRVKDKLISYLEDTFKEVERKIKPLTNIKIALSNDDHYRIGYIIATIDTLEVNLKKLKMDLNLHQHVWDDEKILDLFDRIKATNTVTSSLIESLKNYLPKN